MKLAASQISWKPEDQQAALKILQECGFTGLEIAPTMVAGEKPYAKPAQVAAFAKAMKREFCMQLCSMQSIWYGQEGSAFGEERAFFLEYTKEAMRFARAADIRNLVFGCPKNRNVPNGVSDETAVSFFRELGEYALRQGCVLALEANPPLYGTNFMNTTAQALAVIDRVDSGGCMLNLDFGTMIVNGENAETLRGHVGKISHVHISEPELAPILRREQHRELAALLREEGYGGYVSIEMKQQPLAVLAHAAAYVAEVFS